MPLTVCSTPITHCCGNQAGPIALRMAKAAINGGMDVDLHTGLRMEEAHYSQVCCFDSDVCLHAAGMVYGLR